MRKNRRTAGATVAVALTVGLAACGGGDAKPSPEPTSEAATTATPTPTPAPTVAPATGLRLVEETSVVRVPQDWVERAEPLVDFASSVTGPGRSDWIMLTDRPSLAGDTTINSLAKSDLETTPKDEKPKRLPNVELDGSPAYMIRSIALGAFSYHVVTLRNGRSVSVDINLGKKKPRQRELVKSVLASFHWRD
jgi:hypothetical protein